MNVFAISFAVGLMLTACELFFLKLAKRQNIPWKEVVFNLDSGHIMMWAFRGVEIAAYGIALKYLSMHWLDRWSPTAKWVFAFFAWDLCFYWRHRMHHKLQLLWAVHVVHHQGEHFNLSLCNRNSWYSSLTDFPFTGVLAIIGVPLEIYVAVSSFHYSVQFYNHSGMIRTSGIFDRFLITPLHHRVHHSADPRHFNRNFGGTFLIWDRLFGTFHSERPGTEMRYGVAGGEASNNPFWASNAPLLRYFGFKLSRSSTATDFIASDGFIAAGGLILFGLLIYYVNGDVGNMTAQRSALFAGILAATVAVGAISDGRRWGAIFWIALALAMPTLFIGHYGIRGPVPVLLFSAWLLHGIDGLRRAMETSKRVSGG